MFSIINYFDGNEGKAEEVYFAFTPEEAASLPPQALELYNEARYSDLGFACVKDSHVDFDRAAYFTYDSSDNTSFYAHLKAALTVGCAVNDHLEERAECNQDI